MEQNDLVPLDVSHHAANSRVNRVYVALSGLILSAQFPTAYAGGLRHFALWAGSWTAFAARSSDPKRKLPFVWTINPCRGCEFACKYCYARYTHEFMELRDANEFEHKIFVKEEAAWLLRQDLKKVRPGEEIAIGTATDPYQPAERRHLVTHSILEELSRHAGLEIGIVAKSNLVLRDLDLLKRIAEQNTIGVHITVTTLNSDLARILEPRAPRAPI